MSDDHLVGRSRRRRRWVVASVVTLLLATPIASAWVRAPATVDVQARVASAARAEGSRPIPLSAVAPVMRQAVVATEDERFWRHHGVDVIGVVRAAAYDIGHLSLAQGASTITEQLAKVLYLGGDDHDPWRKLESAALAWKIEHTVSKDTILADYLDVVYFGHQAWGIDAASHTYFGIPPATLSLAQASMLAGLIQAPGADDPYVDPATARDRQVVVLTSMVRNGDITTEEASRAARGPMSLVGGGSVAGEPHPMIDAGPSVSNAAVAGAVLLVAIAIVAAIWRRHLVDHALAFAVRLGGYASGAIAVVMAARAVRMD